MKNYFYFSFRFEGLCFAEMTIKGCYTLDYGNVSNLIGFGGGDGVAYICDLSWKLINFSIILFKKFFF